MIRVGHLDITAITAANLDRREAGAVPALTGNRPATQEPGHALRLIGVAQENPEMTVANLDRGHSQEVGAVPVPRTGDRPLATSFGHALPLMGVAQQHLEITAINLGRHHNQGVVPVRTMGEMPTVEPGHTLRLIGVAQEHPEVTAALVVVNLDRIATARRIPTQHQSAVTASLNLTRPSSEGDEAAQGQPLEIEDVLPQEIPLMENTPTVKPAYPGGRKIIGEAFTLKGAPQSAINTILSSLSDTTLKQYDITFKLWWEYCMENRISLFKANNVAVMDFLQKILEQKNPKYGTVNSHRSALSLILQDNIGSDPVLNRFMRGVSKLKPSRPKYNKTWDPGLVLKYLESLGPNAELSFKLLSYKLLTLLLLITGHRVQTMSLIRLSNIVQKTNGTQIAISDPIKTSHVNRTQPYIYIPAFQENPNVCAVSALTQYLEASKELRETNEDFLFYNP
ncbi:hypothetical protein NQ315_015597 [Exocentrus adspersus]|uniref:Uncharacterized protein n=1 Tax=Exocentrus adspersus TaxID=1586481 RepID=A0AAV8VEE1_9CUCU|nr:hypothetical protein NQ315_015597 [Exocentrus adspersus]